MYTLPDAEPRACPSLRGIAFRVAIVPRVPSPPLLSRLPSLCLFTETHFDSAARSEGLLTTLSHSGRIGMGTTESERSVSSNQWCLVLVSA